MQDLSYSFLILDARKFHIDDSFFPVGIDIGLGYAKLVDTRTQYPFGAVEGGEGFTPDITLHFVVTGVDIDLSRRSAGKQ